MRSQPSQQAVQLPQFLAVAPCIALLRAHCNAGLLHDAPDKRTRARAASIALNGRCSIDLGGRCAWQTGWGTCCASHKAGSHLDRTSWSPRNRTREEPCVRRRPAGQVAARPRNNRLVRSCRPRRRGVSSTEGENISSRFVRFEWERQVACSHHVAISRLGEIGRDTTAIIAECERFTYRN